MFTNIISLVTSNLYVFHFSGLYTKENYIEDFEYFGLHLENEITFIKQAHVYKKRVCKLLSYDEI